MTELPPPHGEDGAVGGLEGLVFGVLLFALGSLLLISVWTVVDTKFAVASAAREAVRAYVEAPADQAVPTPLQRAEASARRALAGHGKTGSPTIRTLDAAGRPAPVAFERCAVVTIRVEYPVEVYLPYLDARRAYSVSSTASELVDPLRSGLEGQAGCV